MTDATEAAAGPDGARRTGPVDWAAVRAAYEAGTMTVAAVRARFGLTRARLYAEARHRGWSLRQPRRSAAPDTDGRGGPRDRAVLIARLFRAVERQIAQIEARLGAEPGGADEKEARTLAALTRTLELLIELERRARPAAGTDAAETDIDAFRAELARRIAGLGDAGGA